MIDDWMGASIEELVGTVASGLVIYALVILYTRITGLRSFSKMSAPDFAMTVAVGSIMAATATTPSPSLLVGGVALATLFVGQYVVAALRRRSHRFSSAVDNQPRLLMDGSRILHENLDRSNLTLDDLYAKLREANVLALDQVLAVVFETTGDVTVLHRGAEGSTFDPDMLRNVVGLPSELD